MKQQDNDSFQGIELGKIYISKDNEKYMYTDYEYPEDYIRLRIYDYTDPGRSEAFRAWQHVAWYTTNCSMDLLNMHNLFKEEGLVLMSMEKNNAKSGTHFSTV